VTAFEKAIPKAGDVETRKMFGFPAGFVQGNMFMGLHQDAFVVRLGEKDRAALLSKPGAHTFEPMPGRPMKEYIVLSDALLADAGELASWVEKALLYGRSLPAKGTRKATRAKEARKTPSVKTLGAKAAIARAVEEQKKPRARTTGIPPRPRRQSGTVKKSARSR
ncbi:MAG TPA: TfoX/Sxy family protein, partial [Polyangiaceae bacterium]|jgi:TfoX/Sxy family transcriptional regulator of competence genes